MEDNYLNDRLRNSMDTPRNIPFDENEWDKVAARLDAAQPIPKPFAWHWVAFAALIPLLGWNIWLHSKLNDLPKNMIQNSSIAVIDTVVTKHTTVVFDTIYNVIYKDNYKDNLKNNYKNNTTQTADNQYNIHIFNNKKQPLNIGSDKLKANETRQFLLTKENIEALTKEYKKEAIVQTENRAINTSTTSETTISGTTNDKQIVVSTLSNNRDTIANKNEKQYNETSKLQDITTENKAQPTQTPNEALAASVPLRGVDIPVDSAKATQKITENSKVIEAEKAQKLDKNDAFDAATPIKVTPAKTRIRPSVQAVMLETGNTVSHRFGEKFGGIGVQFKVSPQWSILTGLQAGGGFSKNFKDSFPRNFPKPMPNDNKDKFRGADIEYYSFSVPIMARWQPSYFNKYRIMPYVSMGSVINFGGHTKIGYRFEDSMGQPYEKPREENRNKTTVFAAANIGAEAQVFRKFSAFTQVQYRVQLGSAQKNDNQYQNLMIQGGLKYNF